MPREADFKEHLCPDSNGFSLHAALRCSADDLQSLPFHVHQSGLQRLRVLANGIAKC